METNIKAFTQENTSGSLKLEFTRIENLRDYLFIANGVIPNSIALHEGAELYTWEFFDGQLSFDFSEKQNNDSSFYASTVKGYIPMDKPEIKSSLEFMVNHRYLVIEVDNNGYRTVLGDVNRGCLFTFKTKHGNATQRNQYEFKFTYNSLQAPPSINPEISTPLEVILDTNWNQEDSAVGLFQGGA